LRGIGVQQFPFARFPPVPTVALTCTDLSSDLSSPYNNEWHTGEEKDEPEVLEMGRLYFAYRPKVDAHDDVSSADDVQRFYLLLEPTQTTSDSQNKELARQILESKEEGLEAGKTFRYAQQKNNLELPGGEPLLKGMSLPL
jgi:hypothetical protein